MRYWIFQCNPKRFNLDARLGNPNSTTTWTVNQHKAEIAEGDQAFIWQAGPHRGLRAIMQIDSDPADIPETAIDAPYWADLRDRALTCRVRGTFTSRFPVVAARKIAEAPGLQDLLFLRVPRGTNFPLSEDQADALLELLRHLGAA